MKYISKYRYEQDKNIQVKNNDILITKDGSIGKVIIVKDIKKPATLNAGVYRVRIKDNLRNIINPDYLYLYLSAPFLLNFASKQSSGGTIKHLNQNQIINFKIPYTTFNEQIKISNFLNLLNTKILIINNKISILKKYKEGLCNYLFINDKNSNIHLYDLVENYPSQMLTKDIEKNVGIYPVYDATGKVFKNIDFYQQTNDSVSIIKYGSGCGRTFVSKGHHSILGTMNDLIPLNKDDVQFLYAYTISGAFRRIVKKYTEIGTTPNLYYSDYSKVTISLKALENKEKISKLIMNIEEHENLLENQLTHLKIMKKNLLNLLFI